ncbi:orexin receptor type 2-like [Dendronephthya gigantea]|uniref:orexin receptor type 2-like n=1 Tax=Dendronephthya gigantea TaxID=151771 RepID=UPI00106CF21E|nr:orexin receptor type 2-like [Dendronephthya gigantea]
MENNLTIRSPEWLPHCVAISEKTVAVNTFCVVLNIVVSLLGTFANGLVITAYYRNPRLRTIHNKMFLLLALTDIGVTAFIQPATVTAALRNQFGKCDYVLWKIVEQATRLFVYLSLITISILSLQSFITLAYPYRYQNILTECRLNIVVIVSWLSVTIAIIINGVLTEGFEADIYLALCITCTTFVTVVFFWCWTYKLIARHQSSIQNMQVPPSPEIVSRNKILRSTVTALAVTLSLLGCYLFHICFNISFFIVDTVMINDETYFIMLSLSTTLIYINSLLNPCLVFWRSAKFRETAKDILNRRRSTLQQEISLDFPGTRH